MKIREESGKSERIERIIINSIILIFIPIIIGVLFYILLPFGTPNPLVRGGLASALTVAIAGIFLTIRHLPKEGAFLINGGFIGFLVQYAVNLSISIGDPNISWLLSFLAIFLSLIFFLVNLHWLGTREKISQELYLKLSKGGSIGFLAVSLTLIVYSSYTWWFGNIFFSLGLGMIIIGAILPVFRDLITSRKMIYLFSMLPINIGISLMIFWESYVSISDLYVSLFLTFMIGFIINLLINFIFSKGIEIYSETFWNKLFFIDFLSISIAGSLFFIGLRSIKELQQIMIGLLWFTGFSFATTHFAYKGGLISNNLKEKLWIIAGFGITFEISFLISIFIFNTTNLLLAIGAFSASCGILMTLFNLVLNKKYLYYINSANILWGFGIISAELIYLEFFNVISALLWTFFVIHCIFIGILLFGLGRKFLEKPSFYKMNFLNWISLSFMVGFLIGWNAFDLVIILSGVIIGSFIASFSLLWAKSGRIISDELFYKLYRLFGLVINLQLATIFSFLKFPNPADWIGFTSIFMIIFCCLTYLTLIKIKKKPLILFNHSGISFGIFFLLSWMQSFALDSLLLYTWLSLTIFLIIIPISYNITLASKKILHRLTCAIVLIYTIFSTWLIFYLFSIITTPNIYVLILFVSLMLLLVFYFGRKGELYSERIYYGLSCASFSFFIISLSIFLGTLLWIDVFYLGNFIALFIFSLLIPDIYLLHKAGFLKEKYYRRTIEVIGHILCVIAGFLLAGFPIVILNNWYLGVSIFILTYTLLSGLIYLSYKRHNLFIIHFCASFSGFVVFLSIILIPIVDTLPAIFWGLFLNLILSLFFLDQIKQHGFISMRRARLGIIFSSLSLSFTISLLVEWYLRIFPAFSIVTSILIFLLLSRVVLLYIISNNLFPESPRNLPLHFSTWACVIATTLFIYFLLNTVNPTYYILGYQLFNIIFSSLIGIGISGGISKTVRDYIVKGIRNPVFLTTFSASLGCFAAILVYSYYGNLFVGINLAILIMLLSWKSIFYKKPVSNYFIIGVPVVLGVIIYKALFNFVSLNLNATYFDNLYIIFYSIGISALFFFILSLSLWKFKSNMKYGFLIVFSIYCFIPIAYQFYFFINPLSLTFTEVFLSILPWLIGTVLISNLGLSYYFKKQAWIFYYVSLAGLVFIFYLISFNFFFPTLDLIYRALSSFTSSIGISLFIFAIFAKYYEILDQKNIGITLGISVISGSVAVGCLLILYQGIDILIGIGLAVDFGIFLYYLSLVCYCWELSKKIWEKGWIVWIGVPIVNAFVVFLSFLSLESEFIIFGSFLAITIGHILFLPVIFYRWRSNFRLNWFIIWAEVIPLSFSAAFYFWFKEVFGTALFTIGIITILLAVLIYLVKMWRISAILWSGLSVSNGILFFVTGFEVIDLIALIGISLTITGLQASILTLFPNIPKKWGSYIWFPVSSGITILTVYFSQINHFDIFLTILLAGLVFLISLYPLILFDIDKKIVYKIIGYGACPLLPLFTGFLIFNILAFTIIDELARTLISVSISMIILSFLLLVLHRFEVLKREYWFISWAILSASIAALFSWFGFYIFHIIDNAINLSFTLLIFEIILIPVAYKYWKILGEVIIVTISVILGMLVNIYLGVALGLIFSAIFLEFQKPLENLLKNIQEVILSIGLLFLLFWTLQIFIEPLYAFLLAGYVILFYPFLRCLMKKQWLSSTLFWVALVMIPAAVGIGFATDYLFLIKPFNALLIALCTFFSLGLVLPVFHKVSKRITGVLWIALGGTLSIFLYFPFISVLIDPFPTVLILLMLFILFFASLPWFGYPPKVFLVSILVLSGAASLLIFNYIYIGTSEDLSLTLLYAFLIESIFLSSITLWQKRWRISILFWYGISILIGLLYLYYAYLDLGLLTAMEYIIGLLIIGILIFVPILSSKLSITEKFSNYLVFIIALTISISYFSSFIFVGVASYIYIIAFTCFLLSSLLLLFWRSVEVIIQDQSILNRFYISSFWALFSIFNISASILAFWCFSIGISFSVDLSLIISINLGYLLFLSSSKFRSSLARYMRYFYLIPPILCGGIVFAALYFIDPSLNFFLILYISLLMVFFAYWGCVKSKVIKWRIHEYLWAVSPIPLVIYVGNLINTYLLDKALAISSGILIYALLLMLLFVFTFETKKYIDYLWIILTISLTLTLWFGTIQLGRIFPYIPEDIFFYLFFSLTIGFGVAIIRTFWQKSNYLSKIIYLFISIVASLTIYFALLDFYTITTTNAFLLSFFIWGNLLIFFVFLPEMDWQKYKYIWIMVSSSFSFAGGCFIANLAWIESFALIPALMVGLVIFSISWIRPPLAPPDLNLQKFIFPIIIIAADVSLGWFFIVLLEIGVVIGILIPVLIGDLLLLALSLVSVVDKRFWKQLYLFIPIVGVILCMFSFHTYKFIDIYLNTFFPILIGLILVFPLLVEFSPFRLLTKNAKILIICIASVSAIITFLIFGYVPFITGQTLLKGLIAAVVVIIIIYSILPKAFQLTEYTYLYLSIALAACFSIVYLLFVPYAELFKKLIVIFILCTGAACLGSYKIVEKKAEQNPQLKIWRLILLFGGFVAIVILTILMFAFHVVI